MKKLMLVFLLMLIIPKNVSAYFCDFEDINRLKKIASNINYSIDYVETKNKVNFKIKFVNLNKELYIEDANNKKKFSYKNKELNISNYKSGEKLIFNIYAVDEYCDKKPLRTIRINLPNYNRYYKDKICVGIENYSLCQKWYKVNMPYDKFIKEIDNYKKNLFKEEEKEIIEYKEYPLLNFILKYYYIFLAIIIIGCGFGIYMLNKKSDVYS